MEQDDPPLTDRIVSAALDLFALRGYAATTIADIADYADTTPHVVAEYFAGKDEILRGVLSPTVRRIDEILDQHKTTGAAPTRTATLVTDLINCICDAGPQVVALLDDPAVGEQVYADAHDGALTARIEQALADELSRAEHSTAVPLSVTRTSRHIRAACAVAAIPTAIAAWAETNPATPVIDREARDTIIGIVLAILTAPSA